MILVKIFGQNVGYLRDNGRVVEFNYDDEFLKAGIALSPLLLPLDEGVFKFTNRRDPTFKGLPHFIADALPDRFGNLVIDSYFAKKGVSASSITAINRLSYVGNKAIGALEFEPLENDSPAVSQMLELRNIVSSARNALKGDIESVSSSFIQIGSSAGGARPKALIGLNEETQDVVAGNGTIPEGFKHFLIKFDGIDKYAKETEPLGYTNIEYAYYLMAKECGIEMEACRLLKDGAHEHFLTARFDRDGNEKIHVQTLCGLTGIDYDQSQIGSYSDYFAVVVNLNMGHSSQVEAFKRMVFNVVAVNHDDHTKNFSFIMSKDGRWSLAPAYDLTHSFGKASDSWTKERALLINGKGIDISIDDLIQESSNLELSDAEKMDIIEFISNTVSNEWVVLSKQANVKPIQQLSIKDDIDHARQSLGIDALKGLST